MSREDEPDRVHELPSYARRGLFRRQRVIHTATRLNDILAHSHTAMARVSEESGVAM